ncbi:MAG: PaaI family thioesterase [Bacteroidales bacterium]|nr:PaaI family thioesterase [Bacteroidales bacterium]HHT52879.1 PaaI family thioesterase [Bacteroidales bacterium]
MTEKRKIKNVFAQGNYNCIACSPYNPIGFKLQFYEEGDYITASWNPQHNYEGYPGILHGGVQALLLDEISAWTVYIKAKTSGVTGRMSIRYKKEVTINQSEIRLRGRILEHRRNLCILEAQLFNAEGELCAEAETTFFLFPVEKMIAEGTYPARFEDFYDE